MWVPLLQLLYAAEQWIDEGGVPVDTQPPRATSSSGAGGGRGRGGRRGDRGGGVPSGGRGGKRTDTAGHATGTKTLVVEAATLYALQHQVADVMGLLGALAARPLAGVSVPVGIKGT